MLRRSVQNTVELQRILSLPRRTFTKADAERAAALYTRRLALRSSAQARPAQGISLAEFDATGGLWASLPVGQGKTLLCEAIPVLVAERLGRPVRSVLIAPAGLEDKTLADRRALMRDWKIASPPPRFLSKEGLAREANAYLLEEIDPEVILIDESDEQANASASTPRRLTRFIEEKRSRGRAAGLPWPHGVWVAALTGTPTRNSIMGYWHIIRWCLGDDLAPVPRSKAEAETWAAALDNGSYRQGWRPTPGPLGANVDEARQRYLDRLSQTRGVVLWDEDSAAEIPLSVEIILAPECKALDRHFHVLRTKWESPSGEQITDGLSLHRIEGHAGLGLHTWFDPKPPFEWSDARREFAAFVRKRIAETAHSHKPLDTEAQVVKRHREHFSVAPWLAIKSEYDPEACARVGWLSDVTLTWARRWVADTKTDDGPRVLWCGSVEFADRLAKVSGLPYYGPQGKEVRTGRLLHAADVRSPMICSWHANKRGFNLQAWHSQGIIHPPTSAKYLEQVIGRGHRNGATRPVKFTILATSGLTLDGFASAVGEAEFALSTTRHKQKILSATIQTLPYPPNTLRWATKNADA